MPKKKSVKQVSEASCPLKIQAIRTKGQNVRFFVYLPMHSEAAFAVLAAAAAVPDTLVPSILATVKGAAATTAAGTGAGTGRTGERACAS